MNRQTVLVTGASSGIGRATVIHFQQQGWNVVATMRSPEKENELTKLEHVLVAHLDVTDIESINATVAKGIETFAGIDVLVNNAGYGANGSLEAFSRDRMMRQINTNFVGVLDVTRAVLPHMRAAKSGVIVTVSSVGGRITFPMNSLYHATKFAIEGWAESMTFEMRAIGVKMKIVEPGSITTNFLGRSLDFAVDDSMPEYKDMSDTIAATLEGMRATPDRGAAPSVCAEVIFAAATDGTDKLRYPAGPDAEQFLSLKDGKTDEEYIDGMAAQFGI